MVTGHLDDYERLYGPERRDASSVRRGDFDATIVVPDHFQAFYEDPHWTARWVLLHIIEEFTRRAGRANIIRESIDRATLYQLLVALEGLMPPREMVPRI